MNKLLIIFALLLPAQSLADTNWYRVAANTALAIDWLQTREIARNDDFYETNNYLGEHPSQSDVNKYFLASIALTNIIGELLPAKYSDYFYIGIATVEAGVVLRNYDLGVRFRF